MNVSINLCAELFGIIWGGVTCANTDGKAEFRRAT